MDKNTTRHSERSEESSITRYKTENVIANVAWQSRYYVINSFRKLAYGKGLIWILRFAQNDGWVKTLGCVSGLPRKVNLARNDRRSSRLHILGVESIAFTMAEILLSLTIIGVVAAITLPSLTGNINERTWNTQRKALYARMSQAIALMGSLNGYGIGATESETASNAAKAFVTNGLAKVYKINNICDAEHLNDCGIPSKITTSSATSKIDTPNTLVALNKFFNASGIEYGSQILIYSQINTYAAAFETGNGESVIAYYNPFCTDRLASPAGSSYSNLLQPTMCVNFVYDLNGKKGPNTVGKDIGFMTAFYPTDSQVVAPKPIAIGRATEDYRFSPESFCRDKYGEDARAANFEELKSLFVNMYLVNRNGYTDSVISKTRDETNHLYGIGFHSGEVKHGWPANSGNGGSSTYRSYFCVK